MADGISFCGLSVAILYKCDLLMAHHGVKRLDDWNEEF